MRTHVLKTHPKPFSAQLRGIKNFEFRKDDRGFTDGDLLILEEWTPEPFNKPDPDAPFSDGIDVPVGYTGRCCVRRVSYLVRGPDFGIPDGFVVMSTEAMR